MLPYKGTRVRNTITERSEQSPETVVYNTTYSDKYGIIINDLLQLRFSFCQKAAKNDYIISFYFQISKINVTFVTVLFT